MATENDPVSEQTHKLFKLAYRSAHFGDKLTSTQIADVCIASLAGALLGAGASIEQVRDLIFDSVQSVLPAANEFYQAKKNQKP